MPTRAPKPCSAPGCPAVVPAGTRYCPDHTRSVRSAGDAERESSAARGYDAEWRKLRAWQLLEHPLCQCDNCKEGALRLTPAEVVDHILPIAEHPELRLEPTNLRSMSKQCHDRHTARTRGWGRASH